MSKWKTDFPVACEEDSYATRREFTKFLGLASFALALGTFAAAMRKWLRLVLADRPTALSVAHVAEIPVGGYKLFNYPTENDPCILLRLEENKFAAFDQRCTHLSCPVYFNAASRQLVCPCHHGFFDAEDGRPIAGPPKRQLTRFSVSVEHARVWVRHSQREDA